MVKLAYIEEGLVRPFLLAQEAVVAVEASLRKLLRLDKRSLILWIDIKKLMMS
jgi:hypothetical protein